MKNVTKITMLLLTILSNSINAQVSHTVTNNTGKTIRIEGINTQVPEDLYFSYVLKAGESMQIPGDMPGMIQRPFLALIAKRPKGTKIIAKTKELPQYATHIMINSTQPQPEKEMKKKKVRYSFEVSKMENLAGEETTE